jgi:hypothetical protein
MRWQVRFVPIADMSGSPQLSSLSQSRTDDPGAPVTKNAVTSSKLELEKLGAPPGLLFVIGSTRW